MTKDHKVTTDPISKIVKLQLEDGVDRRLVQFSEKFRTPTHWINSTKAFWLVSRCKGYKVLASIHWKNDPKSFRPPVHQEQIHQPNCLIGQRCCQLEDERKTFERCQ